MTICLRCQGAGRQAYEVPIEDNPGVAWLKHRTCSACKGNKYVEESIVQQVVDMLENGEFSNDDYLLLVNALANAEDYIE